MGQILATYYQPPLAIAFIIGFPSIILYILEVVILVRNWKQFNSSFFRLFLVRAVPNLLNYFVGTITLRFGRLGWFYSFYMTLPNFVLALTFFLYYCKIWFYLFPCSIAVSYLLPLSITLSIFWRKLYIEQTGEDHAFSINYVHIPGAITNSEYAASSSIIFCIICAFLNTATLLVYSRQRIRQRHMLDRTEERNIELRLTIYTFFTFLAQLAMAIYMIFVTIGTAYSTTILVATLNQSPLLSDLCTVAMPSWLLLWASRNVRQLVLNCVPEFLSIKLTMCSRKVTPNTNISMVRSSVRSVVSPSHIP